MRRYTIEEINLREARKKQMQDLYKSGMGYQEIANEFDISRQRVFQIIGSKKENYFQTITAQRCVYVGLREWMNDNKVSINELTRGLYGNAHPESARRVRDRLCGKAELTKTYIDKILKTTGLTYEVAFEMGK